jgi:hypothetical protein
LDAGNTSLRFIPLSEKSEKHMRTQDEQTEEMDKNVEQTGAADLYVMFEKQPICNEEYGKYYT